MQLSLPFKLYDQGDWIREIHRKLASIKNEFREELSNDDYLFLSSASTTVFDSRMASALNAFKRKYELPPDGVCDEQTWYLLSELAGWVFSEVFQYELETLSGLVESSTDQHPTRGTRHPSRLLEVPNEYDTPSRIGAVLRVQPANEDNVNKRAHEATLAGLAFSGGGVRSATFNLGILQALAQNRLLREFDYLSTVSGGGYIGAWFTKWLKRLNGDIRALECELAANSSAEPRRQEADEIRFLRRFTASITPNAGLFSVETWALGTSFCRNLSLNLAIAVTLIGALLVVPRMLASAVKVMTAAPMPAAWIATLFSLWSAAWIGYCSSTAPRAHPHAFQRMTESRIVMFLVLPLVCAAFFASIAVWQYRTTFVAIIAKSGTLPQMQNLLTWAILPGLLFHSAYSFGWTCARHENRAAQSQRTYLVNEATRWLCLVIALAVGLLLLIFFLREMCDLNIGNSAGSILHLVTMGVPTMLILFAISMTLSIGLAGNLYTEILREWWSRLIGWIAIASLLWLLAFTLSLYAPPIVMYIASGPQWLRTSVTSTWFLTTLAALALGRGMESGSATANLFLKLISAWAPIIFAIGALMLISTLAYLCLLSPETRMGISSDITTAFISYFDAAEKIENQRMLIIYNAALMIGIVLAIRVDIKSYSLLYMNRLVRTYLGAIESSRSPSPFTGFDERDDLPLDLFCVNGRPQRPIHIFNSTVTLASGKEIASRTKTTANFTFTSAFCGFEVPSSVREKAPTAAQIAAPGCYRGTAGYRAKFEKLEGEQDGVTLGMAMAVSGAASNPNAGSYSTPGMVFLMTFFNVHIGRWFPNPLRISWNKLAPREGLHMLILELLGFADARSRHINLSDGADFENLGIYELVRRRCRLIVAVDASDDEDLKFEDLGTAIRKCYTDLHVEIDIDVRGIAPDEPGGFSTSSFAVGTVRYDSADKNALNGTLIYIKPSMLGTERTDVLNFRKANDRFPRRALVNSSFGEAEFECYRALGHSQGMAAFSSVMGSINPETDTVLELCRAFDVLSARSPPGSRNEGPL